jgi:thymidylate synthase (FAD)
MPADSALSAKLIFPTKEIVEEYYLPIIYTACRTCYSEQVPDQIWDKAVSRQVADEKQQSLVRKVMESGHGSTIEHVNFTFAISGVTRTLSHQLVRHRAGTAFDQQSQRYVAFKKRDNYTIPDSITKGDLPDDLAQRFQQAVDDNLDLYGQLLQAEVPAEDARFIFPNAMQTNLIMTVNLRELIHMSGLRLCTMAQWEIRQLFKQIRHEIFRVSPFFGSFLAPKCVPLGYCDEMGNRDEHCRIRPHRDTVMAVWEAYRAGDLAETDGPIVPESSPFRPRPRKVPIPVAAGEAGGETMPVQHAEPPEAAIGQAGGADRV